MVPKLIILFTARGFRGKPSLKNLTSHLMLLNLGQAKLKMFFGKKIDSLVLIGHFSRNWYRLPFFWSKLHKAWHSIKFIGCHLSKINSKKRPRVKKRRQFRPKSQFLAKIGKIRKCWSTRKHNRIFPFVIKYNISLVETLEGPLDSRALTNLSILY